MKAEYLIKNNALTDITVCKGQKVVPFEIALTALNMAKKEAYNQAIEDAANNAQLDCGDMGIKDQYIATDEYLMEFGITVDKQSILKLKK